MLLISTWRLDTQRLHVAVLQFSFLPPSLAAALSQARQVALRLMANTAELCKASFVQKQPSLNSLHFRIRESNCFFGPAWTMLAVGAIATHQ